MPIFTSLERLHQNESSEFVLVFRWVDTLRLHVWNLNNIEEGEGLNNQSDHITLRAYLPGPTIS